MLGLHYCTGAFSNAVSGSYPLVAVHGLLIAVASLVEEHIFWNMQASVVVAWRLSGCGVGAQRLQLKRSTSWTQLLWHISLVALSSLTTREVLSCNFKLNFSISFIYWLLELFCELLVHYLCPC